MVLEKKRKAAVRKKLNVESIYAARRQIIKMIGHRINVAALIYTGKYTEIPVGCLYFVNKNTPFGMDAYLWESWDKKYKGLGYGYHYAYTTGDISEKLEW